MTAWASITTEAPDSGRMEVRHSAAYASVEDHKGQPLATDYPPMGVNTQNSLLSGSAITTQLTSPWPMSMRVAPRDETVDLLLLITVDRWSEVEMQPILPGFRHQRWAAAGDLRTAARRANRGLLVLIPDQRPAQRRAPEVPDLLRTVTRQRSDESTLGEEAVARLDDAELVAFGVGEHHVTLARALTNVDVPSAEGE